MISSMTGFSRVGRQDRWGRAAWELRSLNHRFLEIGVHLPRELAALEQPCRDLCRRHVRRGKVICQLEFEAAEGLVSHRINRARVRDLLQAMRDVQELTEGPCAPIDLPRVLEWPGVLQSLDLREASIRQPLLELLQEAVTAFVAKRRQEGESLGRIFREKCGSCAAILDELRQGAPQLADQARQRLREQVRQLAAGGADIDPGRLEQELVLLLRRSDATEELDRLGIYLEETRRLLERGGAIGKHLNFLLQELHRESHTLAAKIGGLHNDSAVIRLRLLVEQMREQAQNVE